MSSRPRFRVLLGAVMVLVVLASACGGDGGDAPVPDAAPDDPAPDDPAPDDPAPEAGRPIIVDYSPTLSDVPALMFLATHSDVDLLAVTLPGTGESDCEPGVRNTRALLAIAGYSDVAVGCGREEPMAGSRDWPLEFREASRTLNGVILPVLADAESVHAEELLRRSLREADSPVTIVALGPLTNLGLVLEGDPGLVEKVESVVSMGGAFDVPGNVGDSPDAEWNLYIDPESVRAVLRSGVPVTFVPLDATNAVPGNAGIFARLGATAATPAGEAVRQLWAAGIGSITAEFWYFWDELAAVAAVEPSVVTLSERRVVMEDSGATVERHDGIPAQVATTADPAAFERIFLETFAGGKLPVIELNSDEEVYLEVVADSLSQFQAAVGSAFEMAEEQAEFRAADEILSQMVAGFYGGLEEAHATLSDLAAPDRLRSEHEAFVSVLGQLLDARSSFTEAIEATAPSEAVSVEVLMSTFFDLVARDSELEPLFGAVDETCAALEVAAYAAGANDSLCPFG